MTLRGEKFVVYISENTSVSLLLKLISPGLSHIVFHPHETNIIMVMCKFAPNRFRYKIDKCV